MEEASSKVAHKSAKLADKARRKLEAATSSHKASHHGASQSAINSTGQSRPMTAAKRLWAKLSSGKCHAALQTCGG